MAADLDFSGKVVIVTGGSRGIGRGIAERFGTTGADVVICGRHEPDTLPTRAAFLPADVREPEQVEELVRATVERFGRLDVLVNNAGGAPSADTATASPRFSAAVVTLNLLAPLYCAQAANRVMQGQEDGGVIVNIGSVSALRPNPGSAAYGAAKAGLLNLTETLAVEWAPKVRVNYVSAGLVRTEQAQLVYGDDDGIAAVSATVPMGRMAEPADVADACLFLASPLARYVTGSNLVVHGGGEWPAWMSAANPT